LWPTRGYPDKEGLPARVEVAHFRLAAGNNGIDGVEAEHPAAVAPALDS
jgi:hypothetical protein